MTCDKCNHELEIGEWPFCPHGKGTSYVIGDDIPGGILIKHGICNEDGSPKRYYSKTDIRRAAFEKNLTLGYETPKPNARISDLEAARRERRQKS